ncbi:hypothetical protein N9L92_02120 [Saprospiraceae bacterium]|nr:hypothetical protein [Saprospiraceae bacterium]
MNQLLKALLFIFAIIVSFNFVNNVPNIVSLSNSTKTNPSCEQLSQNEFIVHSGDDHGCLLWGYINLKGNLGIDVKRFETDTKVYYWWTVGQFLIKSDIKELDTTNTISIPNSRKARLHVRTECGSAQISIKERMFKK